MFRQGLRPMDARKHEGKRPSRIVIRVIFETDWSWLATTESGYEWRFCWIKRLGFDRNYF